MINNVSSKNLVLDEPNHISEHFNNHFCNIAKKIEKEIPQSKKIFTDYLKQPLENTFFINPTTPEGVKSEIKTLKGHVHKYEAAFDCGVDILMAVTFLPIVLFQKQNQKMI